ncbi:nitronate monooxygenase [Flavobacterium sp. SUN046]|uniref:NAD(P)H-dependent flavin oxidoreductase n=1 Tax=Flavobacterium sp. SUN046 TaxID=3002440 RepID=UPI002DBEA503|nr:nitronate monooxygenase [Flavobacterium sp. SUN046]MEC4048689.1 nitronate monooxygenase [Flavobacterium sp. SUN046]
MKWTNDITQMLNIEYPIIQAPMFGVTTPEMVAAASRANCLGSLALADLSADKCVEAIRTTKELTNKTFAVNIFVHQIPEITEPLKEKYIKTKIFIEQLAKQNNLDVILPNINELKINSYHEQIDAIIEENCKIVSFTFGNLDQQSIDKLKSNGTTLIGTCTSVNEAIILEKSGIDIICVQGLEAGGHRGSFSSEDIPKIGGLSLLAQVNESVDVPIIYAGGIYNAKTLLASKILGASGFQIGSLLLGSAESALKDFEKERLRKVDEADIVLTNSFSGRFARGIKNTFISATEHTEFILPYPYQNKITNELRRVSKANQNTNFVNIWVGQSINNFSGQSTTEIIRKLIVETEYNSY